ncbi:hypothetical protein LTR99_000713 [Exophiala xenobiotica]|uniref:BTB domain-containing protein n=1 Tax=Vermiconidia calcicola TaxID=1690605 RepID=A0AAV9QM12_9PEZI|nr:hypothetical protein LTR72_000155 [Exophiala xenobiotica]KAK5545276.1 hypothetical protein LTR25_000283 [Vermiconidia calcicola]KAK5548127.1 hypothetical protein LTR23_001836 [Chaetothyriales sp. CCFEE 6169]KAK5274032.1 hypothetical protein LTR96_000632 [Exophiala xenobiotica]KAK5299489.1 hypothetical protein LTR14_001703 [Exophiala xenobiotica]
MAPNPKPMSNGNGQRRKPYAGGRMIQPALPLIPGLKGKPASQKHAPAQVESEKVESSQKPGTSTAQADIEKAESISTPSAAVNGDNQVHTERTAAAPAVIAQSDAHFEEASSEEKDITEQLAAGSGSDTPQEPLVTRSDGKTTNGDLPETAPVHHNEIQHPSSEEGRGSTHGTEDLQEIGGYDKEKHSTSSHSQIASVEAGEEESEQDVQGIQESARSDEQSTFDTVNGNGTLRDRDTPAHENSNGTFTPDEEAQNYEDDQATQDSSVSVSAANPEENTNTNGFHEPMTAPSSSSQQFDSSSLQHQQPRVFNNGLAPLQDHLLQLANTKEGVDWAIQVNPPGAQPYIIYAHSMMMLRSGRLRRLLQRQIPSTNYAGNSINLYPARYVLPHAFEAALRFLYSDTVLSHLVQPHPGPDFHAARIQNLDYILSYWVAGIELGIEQVSACAERLLSNYLDWDILEITYKHAVDLANAPVVSSDKNTTGSDYVVASNAMVRSIMHFLATRMDISKFKVDANSTPIHTFASRLPQPDSGRPKQNPALASMVFGSMPSSADMSPTSPQSEILPTASTFRDTVVSNILLNVDFEHLYCFNSILQTRDIPSDEASQLMASVVGEREARRQKVLDLRSVSNKARMANSAMWEPVGWKEDWEGGVLQRERVGFLLPASSN